MRDHKIIGTEDSRKRGRCQSNIRKKNPKLFYANEKLTEVNNKLKKKTTLGTFINKGTNLWAQTVRKVQWREFDIISPLEIHLNH